MHQLKERIAMEQFGKLYDELTDSEQSLCEDLAYEYCGSSRAEYYQERMECDY